MLLRILGMGSGVGKTEIRFAFRAPEPAVINQPGRQIYIRIPTIDYFPIRRINYRFQIAKGNAKFDHFSHLKLRSTEIRKIQRNFKLKITCNQK